MTKIIKLDPPTFVEVFMLCLSWQWESSSLVTTFTTVDKVLKILLGIGCITDAQVKMVQHKLNGLDHQRALRRHTIVLHSSERGLKKKEGDDLTPLAKDVLRQERALCVNVAFKEPTLTRLVRDAHIHLTYVGAAEAATLAVKYAEYFTRSSYKFEEWRRDLVFQAAAARATASANYREVVNGEDEGLARPNKKRPKGPQCTLTRLW